MDAQWRASKLKYFLYRRALQQVFDYVQDLQSPHGPARALLRAHAQPAQLRPLAHRQPGIQPRAAQRLRRLHRAGLDRHVARTPNVYRGELRERTFETAFLEYGAMQNLVRATGRRVWYLNDPIEDNPNHDWNDYRRNWESTLIASLLQPEVWHYEVAPWPERIFDGRYPQAPTPARPQNRFRPAYATELQTVMNALNDMNQTRVEWDCGTTGIGVLVSDSLMFERGDPTPSDPHLSHIYGLALPLLKRGIPVTPVQLENVTVAALSRRLQHLAPDLSRHEAADARGARALADWVKHGGSADLLR